MWYVVQVASGREAQACKLINKSADTHAGTLDTDMLKECFVPIYQTERKFHGVFKLVNRNLFPGYVIAISKNVDELNSFLRKVPAFTKILGNGEAFVPLDRNEAAFINSFTSERRRVIPLSRAVAEGDRVRVVEGPMIGREGWIKEINRRKGIARIEAEMFGQIVNVEIGLAVMSKAD